MSEQQSNSGSPGFQVTEVKRCSHRLGRHKSEFAPLARITHRRSCHLGM